MRGDPGSARDAEDARLLRQLALAHEQDDPQGIRRLTTELMGAYWPFIRNIARARLRGAPDPHHDAEEVAQDVMKRLARALANKQLFNKPFRQVVLDNIDWQLKDYWKSPTRRDESDPHDLAALPLQRRAPEPLPSLEEQARDFAARLEGLSERDRTIVVERLYVGRTPEEIAQHLGVSRAACDTASSRAFAALRAADAMTDVRKRRGRSE
ncbi:MAG TPA: sigma-70 family RNA polymerase sigma factor [Thermoleophilaceae bacterium]|jgi:RNA polymerase sigma factor (sigma-70 family)